MKTRLLKKLRKKFYIEYIPGLGEYRVKSRSSRPIEFFTCANLKFAREIQRENILEEGWSRYEKYGKRFILKN